MCAQNTASPKAPNPLLAGVFQSSGRFAWPPLMELWPPLMELAGDRPTDQIAFFLDSEAFQSSIGRRDQCLGRFPFVLECAKDRTERKRLPSPELRSASRRWLCAAWWNTLLRRTGHLFELPAPNATRSFPQKLGDQGGCHDQNQEGGHLKRSFKIKSPGREVLPTEAPG